MDRMALLAPLAVLFLSPTSVLSQERNRFADVLALQEAVRQLIENAEPSIACILVSRSAKLTARSPVGPRRPGRLDRFELQRPAARSGGGGGMASDAPTRPQRSQ